MSWFSGIVTGIKTVFGAGQDGTNNVMTVAKGIGGWIDEQKFTEEEKAKYNAEMIVHYSDYMKSTVTENTQRSRTRRDIAVWVIKTEIFLLLLSAVFYKFDAEMAEYLYKLATTSPMDYLVLGIGAFFFGAHLVRATKGN